MMDKTAQGLIDYDPAVFLQYAKAAGVYDWALLCAQDLDGLRTRVQEIVSVEPQARTPGQEPKWTDIVDLQKRQSNDKRLDEYKVRAIDVLRIFSVPFDKMAHAMALSTVVQNEDIAPITSPNPFKPDATTHPILHKAMRLLSFVIQGSLPEKLLYPPAHSMQSVDHYVPSR